MIKYSILSFAFGNYEKLREPKVISKNCEYIYVTDNKNLKSNNWNIIYTNKFKNHSPIYASFYVRYHPFEFVNTDIVIIIDGSIQILDKLDSLIENFSSDLCIMLPNYYNGTYLDGINLWKNKNYSFDKDSMNNLYMFCKYFNVLNEKGIIESGFKMLKRTPEIEELNEEVWNTCLFLKGKDDIFRVDQYVYSVILSKKYIDKISLLKVGRNIIQSKFLQYYKHNTDEPIIHKRLKNYMWFNNKKISGVINE